MTHSLRVAIVPAYLVLCLILGGASAAGFLGNLVLQVMALPVLVWALAVNRGTPLSSAGRQLMAIMVVVLAVIAVQLVPLPPALWTALPGRAAFADGYRLLEQPLPWLPISLAPHATLASALWLLPALAVCLGIVVLGAFRAEFIGWAVALVTTVSVGVGALQIASGDPATWYFYRITNYGATTGFFANANHMATLLVATVPLLTALYLSGRAGLRSAKGASGMFVILAGALTVIVIGVAINASLAGIGLSVPVVAASLLMLLSRKTTLPRWWLIPIVALTALSVAVAFSAPFQNNLTSAGVEESQDSRYTSITRSIDVAGEFMPVGSGIGTFADIYRRYEDSVLVNRVYINHVHSDYVEIALETGVIGVALVLSFMMWWVARTFAIWSAEQPDHFARGATIASAAILAHSLVDYPLRTAAISALFAACLGLMVGQRPKLRPTRAPTTSARHLTAE